MDQRRAEVGLEPVAEFLSGRRFQLKWNVEEQLERMKAFAHKKQLEKNNEDQQNINTREASVVEHRPDSSTMKRFLQIFTHLAVTFFRLSHLNK
ncbi:MAG: hypothetical protein AAF985_24515 [Bacteroidota bacterium]